MIESKDVLHYWFEGVEDDRLIDKRELPFRKWFSGGAWVDQEIRELFEDGLARARRGEYKIWEADPRGRLALIVLFDQFSRNMFRGTPRMFETDPLALELCLGGIQENADQPLALIERLFFYMPLMHSEDLRTQKISVVSFETLLSEVKERQPKNAFYYEENLRYARQHCMTIERFGRFPYRNRVLARVSTPEEEIFFNNKTNS